jgi:hypothetical protein
MSNAMEKLCDAPSGQVEDFAGQYCLCGGVRARRDSLRRTVTPARPVPR